MNLLPKDEKFFELFERHSQIVCRAARLFTSALEDGYGGIVSIQKEMTALEDEGDRAVHEIFAKLRSTFITPFDPEDIQALASALDNVLDGIDHVTFRIVAYNLTPIPPAVNQLAERIYNSAVILGRAIEALHRKRAVDDFCIEVNRIENEADEIERKFLLDLFRTEKDPIALMKQKEIVELLEATTDRCEDVADVIQNVSVKHH